MGESVPAPTGAPRDGQVVAAYDAVADAYADHLVDELIGKPFDRWLLARIAGLAVGPIVDAGCGPGHVAAHLADAGAEVHGVDLSFGMVAEARRRFPHLTFAEGDLRALPPPPDADAWGAVVAWYSLVHTHGPELADALGALAAAVGPGGVVAFAVHLGDEVRHVDELFDQAIDLDFVLHDPAAVLDAVAAAGLVDVEWYRRSPYAGVEVETERLYVLARTGAKGEPPG